MKNDPLKTAISDETKLENTAIGQNNPDLHRTDISHETTRLVNTSSSSSSSTGQKQFGGLESNIWKICIGAPIIAARTHQTRAFTHIASLLKRTTDFKSLPSSLYSRYCSSSSSPPPPSSSNASKTGFLGWYLAKLHSNPVITKGVSTSIIFTISDLTAQYITMPPEGGSVDLIRMMRMSSYGLLIMGPAQHYWFNFLSRILPGTNLYSTCAKIFMGQTVFGPCINSVFFSYNASLQGENQYQIMARLKRDLIPTLKSGVLFWPLCDFVTFTFVPVHLQPLMNSSFAYLWTIYLTYMASLQKVDA